MYAIRSYYVVWHKKLKLKLIEADIFRMRPEAISAEFNDIESKYWLSYNFV